MTKINWKVILLCFVIVCAALVIRFYNLTYLPVFADEAIYIRWSQVMRNEPSLRFLPLSDGKQPLFMWISIPFLKVFSDPLFAARSLSVLTGMATLIGLGVLSFLLFKNWKVSVAALLIYALSPFAVFFDRMALADSMLSTFGIWTLVLGLLAAKTGRLDFAMLTGFALGGALLTKSPALFFVLSLPLSVLFSEFPEPAKKRGVHAAKLLGLLVAAYLIGYGLYNILRLGPNFHMIALRNQDYVFPVSHFWENPKDPFIFHIDRAREWFWILGPSSTFVMAIAGIALNIKKYLRQILFLSFVFLFPIVVQSEFAKVFTTRYVFFSFPYFAILGASIFLPSNNLIRKVSVLVLMIFIVQSLFANRLILTNVEVANLPRTDRSGYLEEWTAGTGIKEVAGFLREESEKGKKIVVGTEGFFGTLPDGLQMYTTQEPNITVIGVGLNLKEVPQSLKDSRLAGNKTYLVINSSRLATNDPESIGLKKILEFPKALRPDFTREYVQFGPRDYLYLFEIQ